MSRRFRKTVVGTFRAIPVISSRVHYTKSKNNAGRASLVASLDIEVAPFSRESLKITSVQLSLSGGESFDLVGSQISDQQVHQHKDKVIYLFRLCLDGSTPEGLTSNPAQTVDIAIDAIVLVSNQCRPTVCMRWKTGVDFSAALNPTYGAPGQSMQRSRRPASLPVTTTSATSGSVPASARDGENQPFSPDGPPKSRQRAVSVSDLGVTVTFTATSEAFVGQSFKWQVLVYNGSNRPRRLTISAIPKRKRDFKGHVSRPSGSSTAGGARPSEDTIADAVVDENLLYALQKSAPNVGEAHWQVICLTTEVRIGSLNPGSCSDFEMEFIPLTKGWLQLEAIRVTDVVSGEIVDIRDLPDIIAVEQKSTLP